MRPQGQLAAFMLAIALSAVAGFICIRIETFNHRAGGYLPRQKDADGRISKWREAVSSPALLEERALRESNAADGPGVLTESQRQTNARQAEAAAEWNRFRDFVSTWGLAQYLLAPLAILAGLIVALQRRVRLVYRLVSVATAGIAMAWAVIMVHRGYWSSLGW